MPPNEETEDQTQGTEKSREIQKETLNAAQIAEKAEKAGENPDKDLAAIYRIEAQKTIESQASEIGTLESQLILMVTELKEAGADVSILKENPSSLNELISTYRPLDKMKDKEKKEAAKAKLMELLKSEGPTASYVKSSAFWIEIGGGSKDLMTDPVGKYKEWFHASPKLTAGITIAVAVGLGVFLGKTLFSKKAQTSPSTPEATPAAAEGKFWTTGKKIAGVGIVGALALYFGKDKIMGLLGSLMKDETLEALQKLGVDTQVIEDVKKAHEAGIALSDETRQVFLNSGEEGKKVLEKVEADIEKKKEEKNEGNENVETVEAGDILDAQRFMTTFQALVAIHYVENSEDKDIKPKMIVAFEHLSNNKISTVLEAYKKAVENSQTKIGFSELGLEENVDMSPEALFQVGVVLSKAFDYFKKRFPAATVENLTVKEFILKLSSDPALAITNKMQASMEEKFRQLKIGSPGDLKNSAEQIFESEAIGEVIEENKAIFIEHLAVKYGIKMETFTLTEKAQFIFNMGEIYAKGGHMLNLERGSIETAVKERPASPKVTEAMIKFWEELQKKTEPLLEKCKEHYDIRRPDNERYDQILYKNLDFKMLKFSDGLQLALLSDGINFDEASGEEGVGQMKEVSMVYLMARILKKRNPEAYPYYISNLIDLSTEGKLEFKMNPRFAVIAPYFNRLFGLLIGKAEGWIKSFDTMLMGLSNLNDDPEKIRKIAEMDWCEFSPKLMKSTVKETYQIPRELFLTLCENFPDLMQVPTSGENVMEMILALGGTLIMTRREDENVGLVWLAGKYYFFKPAGTLLDSTAALTTQGLGVASKTYLLGTAPFIVIGAAAGFKRGLTSGPVAAGISMLKGAGRGATAPISMPIAGYRAGRGVVRYTNRWFVDRFKFGGGNSVTLERSLRLFLEYSDKAPSLGGTLQDQLESVWDQFRGTKSPKEAVFQVKRRLYGDLYEEARVRWGKNFARDYNNFFDLNPQRQRISYAELNRRNLAERGISLRAIDPRNVAEINDEIVTKAEHMEKATFELRQLKDIEKLDEKAFMDKLKTIFDADEFAALEARAKKIGPVKFRKAVTALAKERVRGFVGVASPTLESPSKKLTTPTRLRNGQYRYMGEKFPLEASDEAKLVGLVDEARETELKKILDEKWNTPQPLKDGPAGKMYRYRGGNFVINDAEITASGGLTEAIEAKYAQSIQISEIRNVDITKKWTTPESIEDLADGKKFRYRGSEFALTEAELSGKDAKQIAEAIESKFTGDTRLAGPKNKIVQEFKIGPDWIQPAETDEALNAARKSVLEARKAAGLKFEHLDFSNSKVLKYFPVLQQMFGPSVAAVMVYNLETSPDKRKAVAETAMGFAAFMGGMKAGERATRNFNPKTVMGQIGKKGAVVLTGILSAMELTEPLGSILDDMVPKFAGDQQLSLEFISLFEKSAISSATLQALTRLEGKVLEKGLQSKGLQSLSKILAKKVENSVWTKVHRFAGSGFVKKVGAKMGLRGAILAATVADDATVIGVLDDFVAVGMAAWMAKDLYDLADLTNKSWKINAAMEKLNKKPIKNIDGADVISQKAIEAALANSTKSLEEMTDDEKMDFIRSMTDIRIKITREGASDKEEEIYRFVNGEVFSTTIKTESGEILELSDEELNQDIPTDAPQEFKPFEIDYNLPTAQLQATYRLAILYTKSECEWTKMDYEYIDDKTLLIKRLDGSQQTKITRSGNKWSVEGNSEGNDLFQAVALANLKNRVQGIIEKEGHVGGTSRPFSIDGESIDFDRSGWSPTNVFDLAIISREDWLGFYDKNWLG